MQGEVVALLNEKRQLQSKHVNSIWNNRQLCENFAKYQRKMQCFREKVQSFHEQSELSQQIINLKKAIQAIKEECKLF